MRSNLKLVLEEATPASILRIERLRLIAYYLPPVLGGRQRIVLRFLPRRIFAHWLPMMDFDVQRCTRRCAATERELSPGETFYSVLVRDGADVVRQDYSAEAWQGAPEGAVGWWKSELPSGKSRGPDWAPSDVMLDYFESLAEDPTKEDVRYVMALLMIRRKILRLDDASDDGEGPEMLVVSSAKRETQYDVPVSNPSAARIAEIQIEIAQLLESAA